MFCGLRLLYTFLYQPLLFFDFIIFCDLPPSLCICEQFIEIDFQKQKSAEDSSLQKTGRILGGFRLSYLFFFGCMFFKENCLVDQEFVKDGDLSVAQYTAKVAKDLGGEIKIVKFTRFVKGEGLEKRADDFAAEVASMVK